MTISNSSIEVTCDKNEEQFHTEQHFVQKNNISTQKSTKKPQTFPHIKTELGP